MESQNLLYDQIYDLVAFRILVDTPRECYETLGVVHAQWKPVPTRFKDYIALPKPNMYQSLHTTVIGPYGERIEIQIRSHEMHRVAEEGIAAHWRYKEGEAFQVSDIQRFSWLRQLLEWQENLQDPQEFLHSLKEDLFAAGMYVFTPKGDLVALSARLHGDRFCLPDSYGGRQPLLRCARQRPTGVAQIYTAQRRHGGNHHDAAAGAEPRLAQMGQDAAGENRKSATG